MGKWAGEWAEIVPYVAVIGRHHLPSTHGLMGQKEVERI